MTIDEAMVVLAGDYRICVDEDEETAERVERHNQAIDVILDFLKARSSDSFKKEDCPVCMSCGQKIDHVEVLMFDHEGGDEWVGHPISYDKTAGCVLIVTSRNWTAYDEYDEDNYMEGIRCPLCKNYPFDKESGCELNEPVEVLMWTKAEQGQDETRIIPENIE